MYCQGLLEDVHRRKNGSGGRETAKIIGTGFGKMAFALPKATLVDFPLALTEGLHHMPRLYGEEVRNHGKVTGMKSGGVVAGKVFFVSLSLITCPLTPIEN